MIDCSSLSTQGSSIHFNRGFKHALTQGYFNTGAFSSQSSTVTFTIIVLTHTAGFPCPEFFDFFADQGSSAYCPKVVKRKVLLAN
jgi:hypothetical protein